MSTELLKYGSAALAAAALLGAGILIGGRWRESLEFEDTAINDKAPKLSTLEGRRTVDLASTSNEGILSVIGLVLVADQKPPDEKPPTFDVGRAITRFRPARDLLLVDPINKSLYEGKVSRRLSGGGSYTAFAGDFSDDQAADVTIKDELFVGYKDLTKIPFDLLAAVKREAGKSYFFVESATLTSTTFKRYRKAATKGKLAGTAFAANGDVFVSTDESIYDVKLSVQAWDLSLLTPPSGGKVSPGNKIAGLIKKRTEAGGKLDHPDTKALVEWLRGASEPHTRALQGARITIPDRREP